MRIAALDLGGTTGWAIGTNGKVQASGTIDLVPRRGESPGMRYLRLRAFLEDMRRGFPDIALVGYEAAHHRGGAATEYGVGCATTVQAWCAERGIEHQAVHTATLKKGITGNGRASKAEMVAAATVRLEPGAAPPRDDNEADAICLCVYLGRLHGP